MRGNAGSRAVLRTDEVLGLTRKIQPASVNDPVTKGKRLPNFWAGYKAIQERGMAPEVSAYSRGDAYLDAFASAIVNAVMLTMRRTVVLAVRICTGLAAPSRTGPIAMFPPAAVFSRL